MTEEKKMATINVSLKGVNSLDPWITLQGEPDDVMRTLWTVSNASRPFVKDRDLFGAVKAAAVEYREYGDRPREATVTAVNTKPPNVETAVLNEQQVADKLDGQVVQQSGWSSAPDAEPVETPPATVEEGNAPQCPHGTKRLYNGIYKSGKKKGEAYRAYVCPADRDDPSRCAMQFID